MQKARHKERILRFSKFSAVSVISALIDMGLFALLVHFTRELFPHMYIPAATVAARIVSSLCNYGLTHRVVFRSDKKPQRTALRYYILVIAQMVCSAAAVSLLHRYLPVQEVMLKLVVDSVLFLMSYQVQKHLVF